MAVPGVFAAGDEDFVTLAYATGDGALAARHQGGILDFGFAF
jgi:hypothetical protein